MSDLRSYRIFRLVEAGMPIRDARVAVASIFQVTPALASRYVDGALARYRVELEREVKTALADLINRAGMTGDAYDVELPPSLVPQALDIVQRANSDAPTQTGARTAWRFTKEAFEAMKEATGATGPKK